MTGFDIKDVFACLKSSSKVTNSQEISISENSDFQKALYVLDPFLNKITWEILFQ